MYHDIVARRGPGSVWFDCTAAEFADDMRWLQQQGAIPISLDTLHRHLTRGEPLPENAVVLTFDDNYQGFFDHAYPILKQLRFPAAMFVHTNYIGDTTGTHPKMNRETLRLLDKEGLVTIGSHTLSHPDDLSKLSSAQQEREMTESRAVLETLLGHPVRYFAYPNGRGDAETVRLARKAGYTLAFTIRNGPAEESPGILQVNRYIHTRLRKGWAECQMIRQTAPAACTEIPLRTQPVQVCVQEYAGVRLAIAHGGFPQTIHVPGRKSVGQFVREAGGVAGINGTFFANAELEGTDNTLIGPSRTALEGLFQPEISPARLPLLRNRPMVFWNHKRIVFCPFQPESMNTETPYQQVLPDYTDAFLAGAWLVHQGLARPEALMGYLSSDAQEIRPRAFFGVTAQGDVVLGASLTPVSSARLGEAAAAAGVQEAVLLDSGYSTSLVYGDKILAVGHRTRATPSRPVPHAIVLQGLPAPILDKTLRMTLASARSAHTTLNDPHGRRRGRRRARRRV
jgi:peptidoglycan/xylan/chitin deacetylase (PgdA/CDA1 family)